MSADEIIPVTRGLNVSEYSFLEKAGQIAGIGGISLGVLLLVFREVIRKNIFPGLSRLQAYNILKLIIILTFVIALVGIAAWVWSDTYKREEATDRSPPQQDNFRRVYFQGFDNVPDDELNQMWLKGDSGDWSGTLAEGVYSLCNISQSDSASFTSTFKYFLDDDQEQDLRNSRVSLRVKVKPPGGRHSAAGILFRKSKHNSDYFAFVLNLGDSVSLVRRLGNSLEILWSKEITGTRSQQDYVKLSIVGEDNTLKMYVNDRLIGEQVEEVMSPGNPGVFAYSKGCFEFDEFSLFQRIDR